MRKSRTIKSDQFKSINLYKAGSKAYYKDTLSIIACICYDYDGYRTAKDLKTLIDDIKDYANRALNKDKLYCVYKGSKYIKDADRKKRTK